MSLSPFTVYIQCLLNYVPLLYEHVNACTLTKLFFFKWPSTLSINHYILYDYQNDLDLSVWHNVDMDLSWLEYGMKYVPNPVIDDFIGAHEMSAHISFF